MAANDRLNSTLSLTDAVAVTPSDSASLPFIGRWLYVGVSGNVAVVMFDGVDTGVILVGLAAGMWHPMVVKKVLTTGTTAASIAIGR